MQRTMLGSGITVAIKLDTYISIEERNFKQSITRDIYYNQEKCYGLCTESLLSRREESNLI